METLSAKEEVKRIAEILQAKIDPSEIKYKPEIDCVTCEECVEWSCKIPGHEPALCAKCGQVVGSHRDIPYVDYETVINRLNIADPEWWWEPLVKDEHAHPKISYQSFGETGTSAGLWIKLHVGPLVKLGVGEALVPSTNPTDLSDDLLEELVRDAIVYTASLMGVGTISQLEAI